jgi:undecaprenyl-phosphate 4-deoxy-4-formamido-L-arabinose transferase
MNINYSVIVPVFNSEKTIEELFVRISKLFDLMHYGFEVIFVDDGSSDNSWKEITKLKENNPESVKAVKLSKNFGQHNATFCGLSFAKGDFIITIDDDLQTPPEEISKLIETMINDGSDMVYGYYKNKKHSPFRNAGSTMMKKTGKLLKKSKGEGSSFRLFTKELAEKIMMHSQNFVFIDELLLWYTDDISFTAVEHIKRKEGSSGYSNLKLINLALNLMVYYSAIPLKIMTWGGLFSSVVSFLIGVYFLLRKIIFHHVPVGYTSLIVAILFSTSLIIFSLGIIGEYIYRMYMLQNKKPSFSIKKVL